MFWKSSRLASPSRAAESTSGDRDNRLEDYLSGGWETVDGWLFEPAVHFTLALAEIQKTFIPPGPVCEIGVWQGRYAALLSFLSPEPQPVIAVDCFTHVPDRELQIRRLHDNIQKWFRRPQLVQVVQKNSREVTAGELIALGGGKFQFISVDGDHTMPGCLYDMRLAEEMLADGGIVAVDDIMNPTCPGVVDAVMRYTLEANTALAPMGIVGNKLFMTQATHCERFRQGILEQCRQGTLKSASRPILDFRAQMEALQIPVRFLDQEVIVHP
jgi:hypothetical protein